MLIEARGAISDIELIKSILKKEGAKSKVDYEFTDYIYKLGDSNRISLNKEFIRIREYQKSQWKHKKVVLVHKKTLWMGGSKKSKEIFKEEFDNLKDAENMIKNYSFYFKFHRIGSQYYFEASKLFIEDLEYLGPSIEIETNNKKTLDKLFKKFNVTKRFSNSTPKLIEDKLK